MIVITLGDIVNVIWCLTLLAMATYFIYSFTVERKRKKLLVELENNVKKENWKIKER
ncbi:hypothetical protein [Bacillus sp. MRMR6]|uniref:hypothetical protein n=1 Tax=Bacillus sp. MRMR6 TaxID=1928617 RepID=UPI00158BC55E|nr:hypothetical protein [Bacillus sp. MRMR6]